MPLASLPRIARPGPLASGGVKEFSTNAAAKDHKPTIFLVVLSVALHLYSLPYGHQTHNKEKQMQTPAPGMSRQGFECGLFADQFQVVQGRDAVAVRADCRRDVQAIAVLGEVGPDALVDRVEGSRAIHQREGRYLG